MKVIQSFSQFTEGSPYIGSNASVYVNFYSFLLSFLTLRKYYGDVTMHCNQKAFDSFIKFIPYSEIVIRENGNGFNYWNLYKVDSIRATKGDVVHVDPDVFIFSPLFDNFLHGVCDGIVQDKLSPEMNKKFVGDFVTDNEQRLIDFDIFNSKKYDGKCYSCGVLGVSEEFKNVYLDMVDKIKLNIDGGSLVSRYTYYNAICEELAFYLTSLKYQLNIHEILPYDRVVMLGRDKTANQMKYTHLSSMSKFRKENVDKIKNKIKKEFPQDHHLIENYETHLKNSGIELKYI